MEADACGQCEAKDEGSDRGRTDHMYGDGESARFEGVEPDFQTQLSWEGEGLGGGMMRDVE